MTKSTRLLMLFWSVVVALSLGITIDSHQKSYVLALYGEAAAIHDMDMEYRNWVIRSGGVYVPVSDKVQPSPWLSDVPERDVTTPGGQRLTLLNSSYAVRLVHEGLTEGSNIVRGHIASLKPINPVNMADAWERDALVAFTQGATVWASTDKQTDGKTYYRYMKPMVMEETCLKCHARHGDKVGDIRGGVSITIPIDTRQAEYEREISALVGWHGLIWVLGMLGLVRSAKTQQRALAKIRKADAQVLLLTNSISHAIYGIDSEGVCTFANDSCVKLLGYADKSELLGKNMHDLVHHSHADGTRYVQADCPIFHAFRDRRSFHVKDEVFWCKDGSAIPVEYWSYPVLQDGKAQGAVVTFLDLRESLKIKEELKHSQSLLSSIVENIPAMVFLKDAQELRFELFNTAGERLLGYKREDLIGKNDHDFFTKEQADFFTRKDRDVLASHKLLEIPAEPIKVADGSERWLHTFKTGLYDEAGQATHLLGISVDISDRVAMEDELRASRQRLAEAQRMAHLGHWELDLVDNQLKWSDEIYRIFEIDPERFGASYEAFLEAIHPEDREEVDRAYKDALKTRSAYQIHHRLLMKDGRIKYVLEKCETDFDIEGKPLRSLGTIQDVTASMFAEKALSEQQKVLVQALEGTIHTVSMAVELRDPYTAGHQRRVADLSCAIAERLGLDEERIRGIRLGATIHDIGKIGIPAEVLSKPARLTDIELSIVREHARMGFDILKEVRFPWPVADIAHQHHERVDGSGYPLGRKGDEIALEARIVAVADVVESMATHRPYRPALGIEAAREEIISGRGSKFDEQVVDACLQVLDGGFTFS